MRIRSLWLLTICPLVLLAACGSQSGGAKSLRIWYSTDDPRETVWAGKLVQLFDKTHPKIDATVNVYGYEDFNPKMLVALGSGNPPDLAYATPRVCGIPKYVQVGKLLDLTAAARRLGWAGKLRPGLLQDYNSPFTTFATKRYGVQPTNVQVYAVPSAMAAVGLMYNANLLHALHLTTPTTINQLASDVVVAKRHGLIPLGLGNADGFLGDDWYQTLVNTRLPYGDLERELRIDPQFSFERQPFIWAARTMLRWRPDFTPNSGILDAQTGVRQFFQGHTLFQLISSSEDPQITSFLGGVSFKVGVFAFPGTSVGPLAGLAADDMQKSVMPQSGYEGWIVPKAGHNHAAAITFINWLLQPSTQRFILRQGDIPASAMPPSSAPISFLRQYLTALHDSRPGVFLDAAPILNLNATMEAQVQFMLNENVALEGPTILPRSLQLLYRNHGITKTTPVQIDCEF